MAGSDSLNEVLFMIAQSIAGMPEQIDERIQVEEQIDIGRVIEAVAR
jgi:hypothetical protein